MPRCWPIILHGWPRLTQPERLQAIEALFGRPALVDVAEPREQVMEVLRRAVTDPSAAVRDRTLRGVNSLPALWAGKGSSKLLLAALADDTPACGDEDSRWPQPSSASGPGPTRGNISSDCWSIPTPRSGCWLLRPSNSTG